MKKDFLKDQIDGWLIHFLTNLFLSLQIGINLHEFCSERIIPIKKKMKIKKRNLATLYKRTTWQTEC